MPSDKAQNYLVNTMILPSAEEAQELLKGESDTPSKQTTEEGVSAVEETQEETQESSQEDSSKEETQEEESKEAPAAVQKRIDELVYKYKSEREARLKLEEQLKANRQDPVKPTSEEAVREQNARDYLKGLYKEIIAEGQSQEQEAERELQEEIDHVSALYPDFKKDDVLKIMEKFGIDNVEKAYLASKEMNQVVAKTKEETTKKILAKPKSPSSVKTQDSLATKFSEENIRGKSIWELAEEAKKEAGF